MKRSRHALLALLGAMIQFLQVLALPAAEPAQSAREALKMLSQSRGPDYLGRVVMVEGRFGDPQPRAWRVLTLDPKLQGRLREFMINGGNIDSERVLMAWKYGRRVPLREVKIDSRDAFLQADLAAKDAKIGFNSLDYQLIMPTGSPQPIWLVTLIGSHGGTVGEVQVGAKTGVVLRKAWPQATQPPSPPSSGRATSAATNRSQPESVAANSRPAQTSAEPAKSTPTGNAGLKEASGQILEGARQGIIRTTGNVRDFFKNALQDKNQNR